MSQKHQLLEYFSRSHSTDLHAHAEIGTHILIQRLDCQPNESILEVGFGTGATLCALAALYPKTSFFGIDQSPLMLEKASERLRFCGLAKHVFLKQTKANTALPFEDAAFDRIYIESVLAIQQDDALPIMLREIKRILKPNGILCLNETIWLPQTPLEKLKAINEICLTEFGIIQANDQFPYIKDWLQMFAEIGFDVVSVEAIDEIELKPSRKVPFWTRLRSKLFTFLGKAKTNLSGTSLHEWDHYESKMQEIHADGSKVMEGFIFKLKNRP